MKYEFFSIRIKERVLKHAIMHVNKIEYTINGNIVKRCGVMGSSFCEPMVS